ncbi:MAG TPA: 2-oxo acid dehydrogenase subunit E2 [Baekduia sp.]|nr:2-oxo acid dehydrogenase subunit E2 [Baekduia sp.]
METLNEVLVPDIGDFTDVPVTELLVAVGDRVEPEDPLVVLESDKATMEVPAPFGGVVAELRVAVGDTVSEGTPLLLLDAADAADAGDAGAAAAAGAAGTPAAEPAPPVVAAAAEPAPPVVAAAAAVPADGTVHAGPAVRQLARERGIDLHGVQGSGRKGRIVKSDLDDDKTPTATPNGEPTAPSAAGGDERIPLTRIQQLSAGHLAAAWPQVPQVTQHEDADITDLEAFRRQLNAEQSAVKVTMVALLLKATATTLRAFPRFAGRLDGDAVVVRHDLHLGFAADTPQGLVVPVVRNVDRKGILMLATEVAELSEKARSGSLAPKEISGAVFTISSLGGIGGTGFTPIVNPPQAAILGVVRSRTQPVWDGTTFVPRLVLPLSLTYDHRVIDGADGARFCVHLAGVLGDLRRALL